METDYQSGTEHEGRELLVCKAGPHRLSVFADQAALPVPWRQPTPLPRAPRAVLGIVSVRGRMLTVLNPLPLIGHESEDDWVAFNFIVPLKGDEQLALAVEQVEDAPELFVAECAPERSSEQGSSAVLSVIESARGPLIVLQAEELFAAAMQGTERRRRRF